MVYQKYIICEAEIYAKNVQIVDRRRNDDCCSSKVWLLKSETSKPKIYCLKRRGEIITFCVLNLMAKFHFQALILLIMSLWGQLYLGLTKLNEVLLKKSIMKQVMFSVASFNILFDLFLNVTSIESLSESSGLILQ